METVWDVKKYSNRRFYDRAHSRHVTLDDMRNHIRQGGVLRAVDSKSGRDITARVLTQILLEREFHKLDALPSEMLTRLIRAHEDIVRRFFDRFFGQFFQFWLDASRGGLGAPKEAPPPQPPLDPWSAWSTLFGAESDRPEPDPSRPPKSPRPKRPQKKAAARDREIEALKQEMAALRRKLETPTPSPPKRPRSKRRSAGN